LQIKDLYFLSAQNELVFACEKGQSKPKIGEEFTGFGMSGAKTTG